MEMSEASTLGCDKEENMIQHCFCYDTVFKIAELGKAEDQQVTGQQLCGTEEKTATIC